jgi:putative FmdB family regulatory protein
MPIYEYQCQKCGTHLEKRQSITDEPLKVCEDCGGELVKMVSLSGFQFKGAGWYVTDYAGKNGKSAKSAEGAEKNSTSESTAAGDDASKTKSDTSSSASKPDASSAKD